MQVTLTEKWLLETHKDFYFEQRFQVFDSEENTFCKTFLKHVQDIQFKMNWSLREICIRRVSSSPGSKERLSTVGSASLCDMVGSRNPVE